MIILFTVGLIACGGSQHENPEVEAGQDFRNAEYDFDVFKIKYKLNKDFYSEDRQKELNTMIYDLRNDYPNTPFADSAKMYMDSLDVLSKNN